MQTQDQLHWKAEFSHQVSDLLEAPEVQALRAYTHHQKVSRFEHAMLVAQLSYRAARTLGWDQRAVARCGILHDLYMGETACSGPITFLRHAWEHPGQACRNAGQVTDLTGKERNIIESHMWPMCRAMPRSREAWLVNAVDSFVAVVDKLGWNHMLLEPTGTPDMAGDGSAKQE